LSSEIFSFLNSDCTVMLLEVKNSSLREQD
jgi:hypothetical protein